jgi:hypothetical protein
MAKGPFDVTLSKQERDELADFLVEEVESAISARSALDESVRYWWQLYEQKPTRLASQAPWPDAADLTSYIGTEKVDALHARMHRTVVGVEPIWSVEGWGAAAERAPIVEEFHQWKAEEERLQGFLDKWLLNALVEPIATLEVTEATQAAPERTVRERKRVRLLMDPVTGAPILDEKGGNVFDRDENGDMVEAEPEDEEGIAEVVVDSIGRARTGPKYRVVPFKDFYMLPGHATDRDEVWAYCKRFYRRIPFLKARVKEGFYRDVIDELNTDDERPPDDVHERVGVTVTDSGDVTLAEKELWEILIHKDLGQKDDEGRDSGERWYLITLHRDSRQILRIQHDDLGAKRFVIVSPIPRSANIYGYSLIGDKLITAIEEHTAWRNANADNASRALSAPILRVRGALWEPDEQPLGPKAVIDVKDPNEIQPLVFPEMPQSGIERESRAEQAAERLAGINDTVAGQTAQSGTTLGEIQLTAEQSFVRMDQIIRRVQEALEDLGQIRHLIYQRTLAEKPVEVLPPGVTAGLESRGIDAPVGGITADTLAGPFRFKPRGSVETADINRQRADFVQFVQTIPALMQVWPEMQQLLAAPDAARSVLQEMMRVFRWQNRRAFTVSAQQNAQSQIPPELAAMLGGQGLGGGPSAPPGPEGGPQGETVPGGGNGQPVSPQIQPGNTFTGAGVGGV